MNLVHVPVFMRDHWILHLLFYPHEDQVSIELCIRTPILLTMNKYVEQIEIWKPEVLFEEAWKSS